MTLKNIKDKTILNHSFNYLFAELFNKGLVFFTMPVFTRLLTPAEYGQIGVFFTIVSIITVILSLNINASIVIKYNDENDNFKSYLGANFLFLLLFLILSNLILLFFSDYIVVKFGMNFNVFVAGLITASMTVIIQYYLSYLQSKQQSRKLANLNILKNLAVTIMSLLLIYLISTDKHYGIIFSNLCVSLIFAIICTRYLMCDFNFTLEKKYIINALNFSIPLLPHSIAGVIYSQYDRLMITSYLGADSAGIYYLSYNIGLMIVVFVSAVNSAWIPYFIENINNDNYHKIQKYSELFILATCLVSLGLILFGRTLVEIMANSQYVDAHKYVPFFAVAGVFNMLYSLFSLYLFRKEKTGVISVISIFCCLLNVISNYFLIPLLGLFGAALSSVLTSLALFYMNYSAAKKGGGIIISIKGALYDIAILIAVSLVIIFDDVKSDEIYSVCKPIVIVLALVYFSIKIIFLERLTWKKFVK
jgi:O-antigen/teichoic acid export membrane protein